MRIERIGSATLYLGDCYEILPSLSRDMAVLTDPPYGWEYPGCAGPSVDPKPFLGFAEAILWAGEPGYEPEGWGLIRCGRWSAWLTTLSHLWEETWEPEKWWLDHAPTWHPHEKPTGLFERCINFLHARTILDPFMGSGTTGVACAHPCVGSDREFIGIEKDPVHFETACRRIADAAQG